jgi:anti-sigma-K factor RskA
MSDEDLDNLAAEYVLGTLPAAERARLVERLSREPALREAVRRWQARLAPLLETAPAEAPPPSLWRAIERATHAGGAVPAGGPFADKAANDNVAALRRKLALWRGAALAATALAVAAVFDLADVLRPPPAPGSRYVAVVDTDGREPAMVAEVDTGSGTITVRSLAAEAPAGRSLELWHVAEGAAPVSLGVIEPGREAQTIAAENAPAGGVLAVSVEPPGGSPSGAPTGPVVYTGRLIPVD